MPYYVPHTTKPHVSSYTHDSGTRSAETRTTLPFAITEPRAPTLRYRTRLSPNRPWRGKRNSKDCCHHSIHTSNLSLQGPYNQGFIVISIWETPTYYLDDSSSLGNVARGEVLK